MAGVALKSYPNCFGCGSDNPIGLKLSYRIEGENVVTDFVPQEEHQGWPGITHGGIITSLLYEVMENYPYQNGIVAMMRGMETRFRRPINTGQKITAKSWLVKESGRILKIGGSLTDDDDVLLAQGEADLLVLREDQIERLGIS
ncbi:MAG: PaaI family thioesterase [Chloroflexi bacterium]|nr:PaaI family thioesterase [Chloroflexota bacterium]